MDAIPSNLCMLVEQLEDSRQFHDSAARHSAGDRRERHQERSLTYLAMLSEIAEWVSRNSAPAVPQPGGTTEAARLDGYPDGYAVLLERVYRIHHDAAPVVRDIQARAAGNAIERVTRIDNRRAGGNARG